MSVHAGPCSRSRRGPERMAQRLHTKTGMNTAPAARTDLELVRPASDQVPQNPRELADKVENFDEMQAELAARRKQSA